MLLAKVAARQDSAMLFGINPAQASAYLPTPNGVDRVMRTDVVNVEGMAIVVK
jgi:hypothetical protein